jgi:CRP/FNR family transcriptional regulator, nitrogen oxide reductase regulator
MASGDSVLTQRKQKSFEVQYLYGEPSKWMRAMLKLDPSLVRSFPFFGQLGEDEIRAVLRLARTRHIDRKGLAFAGGQNAGEFFVLLHGHLKVVQTSSKGQEPIARIVKPGELYGMAVALGRKTYPATAIALEESITLVWPSSTWASMLQRSPALAVNALQALGQRVQEAHARVGELSTEDVERRVAHALLRLSKTETASSHQVVQIGYPVMQKEIAEMSGTTLFSVSRVLSTWKEQGIVVSGRERIVIRDMERLKAIAAGQNGRRTAG